MKHKSIKSERIVILAAVGDIALTHEYNRVFSHKERCYPFTAVKHIFLHQDIVLANLEAPLCHPGETYPMKCSLRGDPALGVNLKNAGINIVSLSNNHILDYKETGFFKTIEVLDEYGIDHFGAGRNLAEARKPVIIERKGIKIGFLGYCDVAIDSPFYASDNTRGIAPLKPSLLKADIQNLKKQVEIVVISLHWGIENWSYPSPEQIRIAHQLIDWGCDVVLGHHPHVIQGIENYKHGYIAYSLGNLAFPDIEWTWTKTNGQLAKSFVKLGRKNRESMILLVTLTRSGVKSISMIPCFIGEDYEVIKLSNHLSLQEKLFKLSMRLNHGNYSKFWKWYSVAQKFKGVIDINFRRIKRIHKLRYSHIKEVVNILKSLKGM